MERVARLASQRAVVIFSKNSCDMCHTIKALFSDLGVNAAVHVIDEETNGGETERMLIRMRCNPSVPAVFIGGELIGGANEVMVRHLGGTLIPLLMHAGGIWL